MSKTKYQNPMLYLFYENISTFHIIQVELDRHSISTTSYPPPPSDNS